MASAPPKPPDAREHPPQQQQRPKGSVRRLKVVVRGMPAGVDPGQASEKIAAAAGGSEAVQWMRLWRASDR